MRKYKYLFWDFDGTLVDSFEGCNFAFSKVFDYFGVSVGKEEMKQYIGPPLKVTFSKMFGEEKEPFARDLYREYYINQGGQNMCKLFNGIEKALNDIKALGYKMYIATSKREDIAAEMLKDFGILDYFDGVFGTNEKAGRIDKKDILAYAIQMSSGRLDECLMIGDSIYDAMASKEVGADCLAVSYGFGNVEDMSKIGTISTVDSPN
ncbi:MAG: HAD hydrolase-like protein, partial [Clostridia bacterium]|nr:HAD hydrolase-like protein [Clostridia bacterium]